MTWGEEADAGTDGGSPRQAQLFRRAAALVGVPADQVEVELIAGSLGQESGQGSGEALRAR
jgi:hypothetical protein